MKDSKPQAKALITNALMTKKNDMFNSKYIVYVRTY